jgi:UDP-glucose 4-epimerase
MTCLRGARALITGGGGAIGSVLAEHLLEANVAEVVVVDDFSRGRRANLAAALAHGALTLVEGDVRDRALMRELMDGIDVIFHQAALRVPLCAEQPRRALEVMVDGTFNVVEAAQQAGVDKLILASSGSIYGVAETLPIDERHHPYGSRTLYAATKVFSEGLLRSYHDMAGLDYVALRYFNVYGPPMDTWSPHVEVFIRWMERIDRGEPPLIYGDGRQSMDFIYIDDVVRANLLAAEADATDEVFNIASGSDTTLNQLVSLVLELMGSDLGPEHKPDGTTSRVSRQLVDTTRAAARLGFRAEVTLDEGLERLITWWRADANRATKP